MIVTFLTYGLGNDPGRFGLTFNGSDKIYAFIVDGGTTVFQITTDVVFRDSGWYHIVVLCRYNKWNSSSDRFKLYVNGNLQTVTTR